MAEKNSDLNIKLWLKGFTFVKKTESYGEVEFSLEQNPMEVLKLGTYAGTCLGLGGIFSESAGAIVLDINKQVVYARDKSGKFIARQLIAISEEKKLICFEVYPNNISGKIKELFLEYDLMFSEALSLPLYDGPTNSDESEAYHIEDIISEDWYDDGPWQEIM